MPDTLINTRINTRLMRPDYASDFRCIGGACEDSCCSGWNVFLDRATCAKYETLPASPLRLLLDNNIERMPLNEDGSTPLQFARIQMTGGKACPLLSAEKLCRIQTEHGEDFLSVTCATYPRIAHRIDGLEEKALSLSCPEAARLVLLSPNLLEARGQRQFQMSWDAGIEGAASGQALLMGYFWPIREFVLRLLANRVYPIWQRLFLLGIFVRRLDALGRGELDRGFAAVLQDFAAAVDAGTLCASMETIPADHGLQLDMVLRLAGLRLPRSHIGERFLATVDAFTKGIGNGPGATMDSLVARYGEAHDCFYGPFFEAHPLILENLLVNAVFRSLFPFGHKAGRLNAEPDMGREFALLAMQFALIKGLLIGVAGFYGKEFSEEHVVRTVQSASKHFEHHPEFLDQAHALLVDSRNDSLRGLTMLVRN